MRRTTFSGNPNKNCRSPLRRRAKNLEGLLIALETLFQTLFEIAVYIFRRDINDAPKKGLAVFRSVLRVVVMFFACAILGLLVGGLLGAGIDGHGPPPYSWDATPRFAFGGLIAGIIACTTGWLAYWYSR
jgi:hypothetical protein